MIGRPVGVTMDDKLIHHCAPGTRVAAGCGMLISSSVRISLHATQKKPRLPQGPVFPTMQHLHKFTDAATGTPLFTMTESSSYLPL
ncbi:hypothetical protein Pelo_9268 [Pelomyxa schiedti]|nr:hypothetical protein Pelo_9268 [Pelomyxa schiedti]